MQVSLKQWRNRWLMAIAFVGVSVGIATAYFTGSSWLSGQVLGTSSLAVQVEQIQPQNFTKFIPGEPQQFIWRITNSGTIPVHLAARFTGNWQKPGLDNSLFSLSAIMYKMTNSSEWQAISRSPITSGESWYLSPTGQESDLVVLDAGLELEIRGELKLASSADNTYQIADFPFSLQVIAKQITADAVWPEYE